MSLSALAACIKGSSSLSVQYRRRKILTEARNKSETVGAARFASLFERQQARLHDLKNALLLGTAGSLPLTLPRGRSLAIEAAPGTGKSSCIISLCILQALMTGSSVIIQDVKFEFYHLWAEVLVALGFRVYVNNLSLNPDFPHDNSNALQPVIDAAQSEDAQHETFTIAEALARTIIKSDGDAKSKYFVNGDRNVFVAITVALAVLYPERCYPGEVYRTIFHPQAFENLLLEARASDALEGDLSAIAAHLLQKRDAAPEHLENFRTGASNALSLFKPSSELGSLGASHDFDVKTIRDPDKPPAVVIDLLPGDGVEVFGPANSLMQTSRIQTLRRHKDSRHVIFLLDEMTNAPAPGLVEAIEMCRSWNIDMVLAFQSQAALVAKYGKQQAESILSSCAEIFFSVTNTQQAEEISKRLGQHTVKTKNYSFGERGESSSGMGEQGHALAAIDDILSLLRNSAFLFLPGCRPILFEKTPYYEAEPFKHLVGDNPNERHPKSKRTAYKLMYGKDATQLGAPTMPDWDKRLRKALAAEKAANKRPRARAFYFRDFLWVPVVSALAAFALIVGTPHVIFDYATRADARGNYACTYFGPSGLRFVKQQSPCSTFRFIRFQKS